MNNLKYKTINSSNNIEININKNIYFEKKNDEENNIFKKSNSSIDNKLTISDENNFNINKNVTKLEIESNIKCI